MDHDRGRNSRASSTSSLGREVRCACQYFQSDSLLPERRAMMMARPSSRNETTKPAVTSGVCEHEYEPVGAGMIISKAPVVRIIDTDVVPVADSDDSIDVRGRFTPGPVLDDGDVILPLDGQIEDSAMEGRELGSGDISEEIETAQQLQDRLEDRFLSAATPCTESRTDGEVNTSQVDSLAMEELPLRRGARGLPQRLRSQAGKLRSRLKSIQRPNFTLPIDRHKSSSKTRSSDKSKFKSSDKSSERSRTLERSTRSSDKRSRMERIRASLPDRPKFNFPQKSKFHLPDRPKINLPKMPSKASFHLPRLPGRRRPPTLGEQQRQHSNDSTAGSRRNIFDFSTVPRLFDRKSKGRNDYATSSPKESRAQSSAESTTLPRANKPKSSFSSRLIEKNNFTQRFTDIKFADDDDEVPIEKERPWRHPLLEKPRLSLRGQESVEESDPLAWEDSEERRKSLQVEDLLYDEEPDKLEQEIKARFAKIHRNDSEDSYEPPQIDPRLYGDQDVMLEETDKTRESYRVAFEPVDPRSYKNRAPSGKKEASEDEDNLEDEEHLSSELEEDLSARSDREQQASSGSSCDRRRRGVIEEIDSDEFFLRAKGISQDDMHTGKYLSSEIRDALRTPMNALADEVTMVVPEPPQRPARTRSMRKRKESLESFEAVPPLRPKRLLRRSEESDYGPNVQENDDSISESRHRIVYHADSAPLNLDRVEPLDDIVVVKPIRRQSRTSLRSSSLMPTELIEHVSPESVEFTLPPPVVPRRRKRRVETIKAINVRVNGTSSCNGYHSPEEREKLPRPKSEPPMKPARAPSRETISIVSKVEEEYIEPAPIPPKRLSRSRATSIIQDDDRTSRGAESIPDIGYVDEEGLDDVSRLYFPGYAIIEKRDNKPPRPPPPRRRREDEFVTPLRASPPKRPVRAYSTLRPRSRTPSENGFKVSHERESTPYVEIDSAAEEAEEDEGEDEHKDLRSGEVLIKMAGRPLPAPPRPPRSRKEKMAEEHIDKGIDEHVEILQKISTATEAFASTQTDPLPDDLVIEEEITQAKLVVAPSRSGSQILVSTERIPSPQHFKSSAQAISHERMSSTIQDFFVSSSARSEPDIRGLRVTPDRESRVPEVPPLPSSQDICSETVSQRSSRTRSKSPSIPRNYEEHVERPQSRILGIDELEERFSAFLTNETLKIASLEVGDLKVDKLSVSTLEAHKIAASEIDAVVVSAAEISNASEEENISAIPSSLLQELIAIKSQLEMVALQSHEDKELTSHPASESPSKIIEESTDSRSGSTLIETSILTQSTAQPVHLQLDSLSKTTETRAIFSTQGTPSVERHQIPPTGEVKSEQPRKGVEEEVTSVKYERRPQSRSRSSSLTRSSLRQTASPVRSLPPVISVTPDTPDTVQKLLESTEKKPQRATISYSPDAELSERPSSPQSHPSLPQSRPTSPPLQNQQFIAFQTSQIPPQFFALASPQVSVPPAVSADEPGIIDMTQQLIRALRVAGKRAMRHFVNYVVSRVSREESEAKIREVELAICALLLIIAGLIIVCFAGPRTITHHHHWDYFNPPRL